VNIGSIKTHRFAEPERVRSLRSIKLEDNERRRRSVAEGRNPRQNLRRIVEDSLGLAGTALILQLGDDAVREHFTDAAAAARQWWTSPDEESADGPRVVAVEAVVDPRSGTGTVARRESLPPPAAPGWMGWTVGDFNMAVDTLIAFGDTGDARQAAAIPEAAYRSPEVVSENVAFVDVAAKKAWLLGDDTAALAACRTTIDQATHPLYRAGAAGLSALIDHDGPRFSTALAEMLAAHKAIFSKSRDRPEGAFALRCLMLARIARSYDIEVEDGPYLPVRFLAAGVVR
jgi:hypothetical protein